MPIFTENVEIVRLYGRRNREKIGLEIGSIENRYANFVRSNCTPSTATFKINADEHGVIIAGR